MPSYFFRLNCTVQKVLNSVSTIFAYSLLYQCTVIELWSVGFVEFTPILFISIAAGIAKWASATVPKPVFSCPINCPNEARVKTLEGHLAQFKKDLKEHQKSLNELTKEVTELKSFKDKMQALELRLQTPPPQPPVAAVSALSPAPVAPVVLPMPTIPELNDVQVNEPVQPSADAAPSSNKRSRHGKSRSSKGSRSKKSSAPTHPVSSSSASASNANAEADSAATTQPPEPEQQHEPEVPEAKQPASRASSSRKRKPTVSGSGANEVPSAPTAAPQTSTATSRYGLRSPSPATSNRPETKTRNASKKAKKAAPQDTSVESVPDDTRDTHHPVTLDASAASSQADQATKGSEPSASNSQTASKPKRGRSKKM